MYFCSIPLLFALLVSALVFFFTLLSFALILTTTCFSFKQHTCSHSECSCNFPLDPMERSESATFRNIASLNLQRTRSQQQVQTQKDGMQQKGSQQHNSRQHSSQKHNPRQRPLQQQSQRQR